MSANVARAVPEILAQPSPAQILEIMTRAVFQAGVKWSQIAQHWDAYREAFANFDPQQVAAFDSIDAQRILAQDGVLRVPRKVKAAIANAAALLAIEHEFGSFHAYVASFAGYALLAKDMKKRFAFLGDMNVWYVLFRCGEPVPRFEPWVETIPGTHPRMREMVELARARGISPEV
jgi:Methyladenine glycosylase